MFVDERCFPRHRGHLGLKSQTVHRAVARTRTAHTAMSAQGRAAVPAGAQNPQEDETPFRKFIAIAQVRIEVPTYSQNFLLPIRF